MFDSGSPTVITELRQSPRLHAKQPQAKVMSLWQWVMRNVFCYFKHNNL